MGTLIRAGRCSHLSPPPHNECDQRSSKTPEEGEPADCRAHHDFERELAERRALVGQGRRDVVGSGDEFYGEPCQLGARIDGAGVGLH